MNTLVKKNYQLDPNLNTIENLVNKYLSTLRSKRTLESYAFNLNHFLCFLSNAFVTKVNQVNSLHVSGYINFLKESATMTASTMHNKLASISSFFRWCMSNQLVQNNPCFDYTKQLPRKENVSKSDAMTYEEVLRLLSVINKEEITGFTHYTGLSILFNLGLRVTEVCSLKLKHFYVNDNNEYVVDVKSKGGEIIPMPVNENLRFMIDRYVEFIENKYDVKFSPDSYLLNSMLCKCGRLNNSDEPPRRNWLNRVIKKYANLAGIEKRITSHSARISAINILLESGENLRGVRDFARHKTVRTTEGYERKLNGLKDNLAHKMKLF